jgi:hypothetical protein
LISVGGTASAPEIQRSISSGRSPSPSAAPCCLTRLQTMEPLWSPVWLHAYGQLFPLCRRAVPVARIAARFELSVAFTNYRINRAGLRKMYEKRMRA